MRWDCAWGPLVTLLVALSAPRGRSTGPAQLGKSQDGSPSQSARDRFGDWRDMVSWPRVWWTEEDFFVALRAPGGMPDVSVTLVARDESLARLSVRTAELGWCGWSGERDTLDLGRLSAGHHALVFDLTLRRASNVAIVLGRSEATLDVVVTSDLESFLPADRSALAAEAVRASLSLEFSADSNSLGGATLSLEPTDRFDARLGQLTAGMELTIEHDGVVVERRSIGEWHRPPSLGARPHDARKSGASLWLRSLTRDASARGRWRVHVVGRPSAALADRFARSWWDGSFTLSLDELISHGEERARRSRR